MTSDRDRLADVVLRIPWKSPAVRVGSFLWVYLEYTFKPSSLYPTPSSRILRELQPEVSDLHGFSVYTWSRCIHGIVCIWNPICLRTDSSWPPVTRKLENFVYLSILQPAFAA